MRYFIIKQHKQYTDAPTVIDWYNKIDVRNIDKGNSSKLPHRILLNIHNNPHVFFTSIISEPIFLVTQEIRDTIKLYDKTIAYKQVVLLNMENALTKLYFMPIFEKVDCLSRESILNRTRSVIYDAVLRKNSIKDQAIFQIGDANGVHIVARLDLVESILKREGRGIFLQTVTLRSE